MGLKVPSSARMWLWLSAQALLVMLAIKPTLVTSQQRGCEFHDEAQFGGAKQVRVTEDTAPGTQIFIVKAYPRRLFTIQALDGSRTDGYFTFREIDRRHVGIILARSLQDLTDQSTPTSDIRFRLACRGRNDETTYLPVTVYVQDINDNAPVFQSEGYNVTIEENTPVGLTVFRGIHATDRDKPNTPNSDINYSISSGNKDKTFSLEGTGKAVLVLRKKLDFEAGDKFFNLTILAQDGGTPALSATSSLLVTVRDIDDMPPKFTHSLYRIQIPEDHPITGNSVQRKIEFSPPIQAQDQDTELNAELEYRITAGNQMMYFHMDKNTGEIFLTKEIDLEVLESDKFTLEVTAWQKDNELKSDSAAVEIQILDINDNKPTFDVEKYNMTVIENLPAGFRIMQFAAVDKDTPENSKFTYKLEDPSGAFALLDDGSLVLDQPQHFDREKNENIVVRVLAVEDTPSVLENKEPNSVEVEIHLLDYNDNSPVFLPNNVYVFQIEGSATVGDKIGTVKATDIDQGPNGYIKYEIKNATEALPVRLDGLTGDIYLVDMYKKAQKMSFFVEAVDQPIKEDEKKSAIAVVELQWPDVQVEGRFVGAPYEWWLDPAQTSDLGSFIGAVQTSNMESESTRFQLKHNYNAKIPFEIDTETGVVTVVGVRKDEEWKEHYSVLVVAKDGDNEISTQLSVRLVRETDQLDQQEHDVPKIFNFTVAENVEGGIVANLSDLISETKNAVHMIANEEGKEKFYLTEEGLLYTKGPLDREERDSYMFTVLAGRRGLPRGFRSQQAFQVKIKVTDVNDNSPVFEQHVYQGHVARNSRAGTQVQLTKPINASDPDIIDAAQVKIEIYGKGSEKFKFDSATGGVSLVDEQLDRQEKEVYYLRLRATDSAGHIGEAQLVIHVTDTNDHHPKFLKLQVLDSRLVSVAKDKVWVGDGVGAPVLDMAETVPPGTRIARVLAEDRDNRKAGLIYSLISEEATHMEPRKSPPAKDRFFVEETSGDIMVKRQVEAKTSYVLNISAQDEGGLSTITQIILRVNDINNNKPVFDKSEYSFRILEGDYFETDVGVVSAQDDDFYDNGLITYSLAKVIGAGDAIFKIDSKSGAISVTGLLDRERTQTMFLTVEASDHGERRLVSDVNVTVEILDVNDNQPIFYGYDRLMQSGGIHTIPVYTTLIRQPYIEPGVQVARVLANDTDDRSLGNGLIGFKLLDHQNMFYIHPETGIVTSLVKIERNSNISVEAADHGKPIRSGTAFIHIILTDYPPSVAATQPSLPVPAPPPPSATSQFTVNPPLPPNIPETPRFNPSVGSPSNGGGTDPKKLLLEGGGIFRQRVYKVQVMENTTPLTSILSLGPELMTDLENVNLRLVGNNYGLFGIQEATGNLILTGSPDREVKNSYTLTVKATLVNKKVPIFFYTLFLEGEEASDGQGKYEATIQVDILDANDNAPEFEEAVYKAAVQSTAQYGDAVILLQASDRDFGENSELVFTLQPQDKFSVNYRSGQVVTAATFHKEAGTIFNMIAKVEDKGGRLGSLSSTAQLIVSILNPDLEVFMVIDHPIDLVESSIGNLTSLLSDLADTSISCSGVRSAGLMTEVRLYGHVGDRLVSGEQLKNTLSVLALQDLGVREIVVGDGDRTSGLGSVEVAVLTIACLVFLGAFIAVLCICCIKLRRSQKHFPAPLAIPLPNYSYDQGGAAKDMMERQASQRFGTIPRVSTIHDRTRSDRVSTRANSERGKGGSCHVVESSEDDANYLAKSSLHSRGIERRSQASRHSNSSHRKSVRSVHEAKSSGESSRSRDSGIDDNRDCCSCRQSSVSSRESYGWTRGATAQCTRCCGCSSQAMSRRHRSSSPPLARRSCSLRHRCQSHRSLPRHAHSHHDLRQETDSDTESDTGLAPVAQERAGSTRRPLYTSELWNRSLTPAQSEARLSQAELRLASTTALRGHSWRGEARPVFTDLHFPFQDVKHNTVYGKPSEKITKELTTVLRTSAKKSSLKQPMNK